ncbi:hypothetical protein GCM10010112_66060 [Actinoplanes lobatus]|uniref:Uncharacterized protein n=1 Tax=Actinoplanes lobatus TaxID=113568 RepID=A0A7W7HJY9_9ACTN|nr:hypothetical protein [Actinoplanes lobatus]MBB4751919.1 hypothetical protein [Actinoplanes lobatus]GGN85538.1 hypothetical protein GCM10010112_66060 [Actinoplanes lobatus]GIE44355.1 hypothetical protein Alo02nite_72530 [Actinoplanes lobatus]
MDAISGVTSSSDARAQLVKYQQQLAKDLAAKAAAKVINADRAAVAKAEQAVQQVERSAAATGSIGTTLDVTV